MKEIKKNIFAELALKTKNMYFVSVINRYNGNKIVKIVMRSETE